MAILSVLIVVFLVYILIDHIYEAGWYKNLTADIAFTKKEIMAGEDVSLIETVANDKYMVLPAVEVKFSLSSRLRTGGVTNPLTVTDQAYKYDVFSLGVRQRIRRSVSIQDAKRGFYKIPRVDVVSRGIFFRGRGVISIPVNSELLVYPSEIEMEFAKRASGKVYGEYLSRVKMFDEPFSFRGIREYDATDPMNTINWKASARTGDLMTNLRDYRSSCSVQVLLNLENVSRGTSEQLKEDSISIAAGVIRELFASGIKVSLMSNGVYAKGSDQAGEQIVVGSHEVSGYEAIQRVLGRIELTGKEEDFAEFMLREREYIAEDCMLVIISASHNQRLLEVYAQLMEYHEGSILIAPYENNDRWWERTEYNMEVLPWSRKQIES